MSADHPTTALLRKALLAILTLGLVGTELELVLLHHTDGVWQWIPLVVNAAALATVIWYGVTRGAGAIRTLQGVMLIALLAGGIGVMQHFRGNIGYASESDPSLSGVALYREALMGSTPALAPGTMVQLALLGLAFSFRHPRLRAKTRDEFPPPQRQEL